MGFVLRCSAPRVSLGHPSHVATLLSIDLQVTEMLSEMQHHFVSWPQAPFLPPGPDCQEQMEREFPLMLAWDSEEAKESFPYFKGESRNHRIVGAGKVLWRLSSPNPLLRQGTLEGSTRNSSKWVLNVSSE